MADSSLSNPEEYWWEGIYLIYTACLGHAPAKPQDQIRYVSGTCSNQNCSTCQWENTTEMECIFCCSSSQVPAKTDHPCNYWLISLLPVASKLFERSCVCIPGCMRETWSLTPIYPWRVNHNIHLVNITWHPSALGTWHRCYFHIFWSKKRLLVVFIFCKKKRKKKEDSLVWCNMSFSGWHPI